MTIRNTVITVPSTRPGAKLAIVPSIAMRVGQLVRRSPFSSADRVFTGTPTDVAQQFLRHTTTRVFHLEDLDGAAASEPSIAVATLIRGLPGVTRVLLEGGLGDRERCLAVAERGLTPIADEAILATTTEEMLFDDHSEVPIAVRGDDDGVFERVARALDLGLWGVVHHSSNPAVSCEIGRRTGDAMMFFSREPTADPDDIETVIDHHRALFRGGAPAVIVDGEWYVDYNTMNEPFDLLR